MRQAAVGRAPEPVGSVGCEGVRLERPFLSVAMPALNEEAILARSVATLTCALDGLGRSWELVTRG